MDADAPAWLIAILDLLSFILSRPPPRYTPGRMRSNGKKNPVRLLRAVGLVEGVSFLLLLGVAMPLKYLAGVPQAVKVVGWVHGVLFMAYGAALLWTWAAARWPARRAGLALVAALVPFGPFLIDRRMRGWEGEWGGEG